jgi:tRNA(Ile)-lysidine synthase
MISMHETLQTICESRHWNGKKIIVAVSGGVDSMVLAALLHNIAGEIIVAHCNFGLRNEESDGDEKLVVDWTAQNNIRCFVQHFDTRKILDDEGGNLQETARDLRYQWFEQLRKEQNFDLIATAHHKQDSVETMLANFMKGTGISGMHGILPQQGKIIRPLLSFIKADLQQFATQQSIPWRDDSSNAKDEYLRNAIRQRLIPVMESLVPNVVENLAANTLRFAEVELLYSQSIEKYRKKLIEQRKKDWYIPILKLKHVQPLNTILWELIKPFGFSAAQLPDVLHLLDAETGRFVSAADFRIIHNRNFLIITATHKEESTHILIHEEDRKIDAPGFSIDIKPAAFTASDMEHIKRMPETEACIDLATLQFPFVLRPWKTGDYFYPLGMNRKKKKVSRFLIEQKVPLHEKEKVWVLESDKRIVWVVGMRPDDRFKITNRTVNCLYFSVNK